MKPVLKGLGKYVGIFLLLILTYLLLLTLCCCIPSSRQQQKIEQSVEILQKEGNEVLFKIRGRYVFMDNKVEALMLNNAYSVEAKRPFYSAMLVRRNYIPDKEQENLGEIQWNMVGITEQNGSDQMIDLNNTIQNTATRYAEYGRYWHGYLVFLRPLLLFFNIQGIRIFNTVILAILGIIFIYLLWKKLGKLYTFLFATAFFAIDYFIIGFCLEYMPLFFLAMIAGIMVLAIPKKIEKQMGVFFFILGSVTNFMDFLTAPVVTVGLPLLLLILLKQKEETLSYQESIKIIGKTSLLWLLGYASTWITKWILVDGIYHKGLIEKSIQQSLFRTIGEVEYSYIDIIGTGFSAVGDILMIMLFATLGIYFCRFRKQTSTFNMKSAFPYIIILFMPLVWYFVLQNHSYWHMGFSYRNMLILLIAFPIAILKVSEKTEEKEK